MVGALQRYLISGITFAAGNGGISRVARLMHLALSRCGEAETVALAANDRPSEVGDLSRIVCCGGNRLRFIVQNCRMSRSRYCVYDSLAAARAHSLTPWRGTKAVAWFHGIDAWESAPATRVNTAIRMPHLITNSEYTRGRASQVHGAGVFDRAHVCWLGTESNTPSPVSASGPPTVLILGRLSDARKGHLQLIQIWKRVLSAVPDARLVIAGKGCLEPRMRSLAEQCGITSAVEFTGFIPESEIELLWARTSLFVMPSDGEGFGLVYAEAMRHAVPVIASMADAGREINVDGVTGYNVPLGQASALEERIIHLLRCKDVAAQLGKGGLERWQAHFSFDAFRSRFLKILSDLQ